MIGRLLLIVGLILSCVDNAKGQGIHTTKTKKAIYIVFRRWIFSCFIFLYFNKILWCSHICRFSDINIAILLFTHICSCYLPLVIIYLMLVCNFCCVFLCDVMHMCGYCGFVLGDMWYIQTIQIRQNICNPIDSCDLMLMGCFVFALFEIREKNVFKASNFTVILLLLLLLFFSHVHAFCVVVVFWQSSF